MDKLRALHVFTTVAETESFSAAARNLNVSAPSVTRIIGELENTLGVKLLHRTTRIVTLTDSGRRYYQDAKQVLDDMIMADDAVKGAHQKPKGILRVTASRMFGTIYITPIIMEYLDLYPEVEVEALFFDRVVNIYEEGLDVAVRIGKLKDSSLMASRVGQVSLQVCGCPNYFARNGIPQQIEDLESHSLIGLSLGSAQNEWKFKNDKSIKPAFRARFNAVPACLEAIRSGYGLSRVLSYQIGPDLKSGAIQTALHEFAPEPWPIHLLHREGRQSSAKVRAFVDLAVERLRANKFLN